MNQEEALVYYDEIYQCNLSTIQCAGLYESGQCTNQEEYDFLCEKSDKYTHKALEELRDDIYHNLSSYSLEIADLYVRALSLFPGFKTAEGL